MTAMTVRSNAERDQHIEAQERQIEALEEIIRVQADTIATLQSRTSRASAVLEDILTQHVHGGRRA